MTLRRVGVVGTGLIGTSIGLALGRRGIDVALVDAEPGHAASAAALGAGVVAPSLGALGDCDHVVVAVPPRHIGPVLVDLARMDLASTVSDVASVKAKLTGDIETLGSWSTKFCGGHPIAGRERGGPGSATPELFDHAVWAITPFDDTSPQAAADTAELAALCGARPVTVSPALHDRVLGVVSHAPQVLASVLAASLPLAGALGPTLAGSGFRDTTRLADSDPALWADIILRNADALAPVLRDIARRVELVADAADSADTAAVTAAIRAGGTARAALPGKVNAPAGPDWARVGVVLADRPGELARVLTIAGDANVNVEDVRIEHATDHPVGFVDLDVRVSQAPLLLAALSTAGLAAHRTR